jgi:hypothetical protein
MGVFSTSAVEEWVKGDDGSYHRGYSEIKGKGFKFASSVGSALVVSSLRYADCGTGPMFYLESRSILSHIKRIRSGDSSGYFKDSYSSYNEYSDVQPEPVHPSEEGRLTFGGSIKGPFHGGRSLPGLMDREIN